MSVFSWFAIGAVVLVALIFFEAKRQERRLGKSASGQPNALGNALLEVQGMLEPERKVEVLQEDLRDEDAIRAEHEQGSGEPSDSEVSGT